MKILIVASYDRSLITFRGDLLKAMVQLGHDVVACAPNFTESVRTELLSMGVDSQSIAMARTGLNPIMDLRTVVSLVRLFLRERPERILSYTMKSVLYTALAAQIAGVSEVYSMITGLGYAFSTGGGLRRITSSFVIRNAFRIARGGTKCFLFQNPDDLDEFQSLGLIGTHTKTQLVNGSGVNTRCFPMTPLPDEPHFLLAARLVTEKGIYQYVEAARAVRAHHPQAKFRLAGWLDSNPHAISESQLESWVLEGVIEYLGVLEDVRPALTQSRVFVLPSYYREGTPRTILEAMSMGRPIITADAPGCREAVRDGVNGLLVPPRDSTELASAMMRFLESPELATEMGRAGRRIAEEKYDVHKVNQVILDCMELY